MLTIGIFLALIGGTILFSVLFFGIKSVVDAKNAQQKQCEREKEKQAAREVLEQKRAALENKYGAPVHPAAVPLFEMPAEGRRAELAALVNYIRKLPAPLLADTVSWEAAPDVRAKKADGSSPDYSLLRNRNNLILMTPSFISDWGAPPAINKRNYFASLREARSAVPLFEEALAAKEESAVDAAVAAHWKEFAPLQYKSQDLRLFSINDVAYFSISEETNMKQTSSVSNYSTGGPSMVGTAINEAIFGNAYATAKAVQKVNANTRSETTFKTETTRTATLYFQHACGQPPLLFSGDDVSTLEAMMPEKRK